MITRDLTIDYTRFIAILLVVIGHFIQYNFNHPDSIYIYKIIYSFHMPLFMFISGYVSLNSLQNKEFIPDLKNKLLILIYPFVIWSIFSHIVYTNQSFLEILQTTILYPSSHGFWFLWALFWIYIFIKVFFIIVLKLKWGGYMYSIILLGIFTKFKIQYFDISMIKYMSIFFISGLLVKKYDLYNVKYFQNKIIFMILLVLFLILANFYYRDNNLYYELFGMTTIIIKLMIWFFKIVLAFIGIYLTFYFINNFHLFKNNIFLKIGSGMTLYVYVTHIFIVNLTDNISLNIIILSIYSILFYLFIKNINKKYLTILFGR